MLSLTQTEREMFSHKKLELPALSHLLKEEQMVGKAPLSLCDDILGSCCAGFTNSYYRGSDSSIFLGAEAAVEYLVTNTGGVHTT